MKNHIVALSLVTALTVAAPFALACGKHYDKNEGKADKATHACPTSAKNCPIMGHHRDKKGAHIGHRHGHKHMDKFLTDIGVSDDQKKQLDEIKSGTRTKIEPLAKSLREQRRDLMTYMASPDATETEALRRQDAVENLHQQMVRTHIESVFRMRSVLTAEQQKKFSDHMKEKMEHFDEHHGEGPPHHDM